MYNIKHSPKNIVIGLSIYSNYYNIINSTMHIFSIQTEPKSVTQRYRGPPNNDVIRLFEQSFKSFKIMGLARNF